MTAQLLAVLTPSPVSILATTPDVGSKNFVATDVQPPSESIVNSCGGVGK